MFGMHSDATGTCDLHPFKETFFRRSNALREGVLVLEKLLN